MEKKKYSIAKGNTLLHLKFSPPYKAQSTFNNGLRIVFVIKGSSTYYTPNGSTELNEGDMILFNNDNFINTWKTTTKKCEVVVFILTTEFLNTIYKLDKYKESVTKNQFPFIVISLEIIKSFIQGFRAYLEKPNYLTEDLLNLKLQELVFILSQKEDFISFMKQINFNSSGNNIKFRDTISTNIFNPINIEELSFLCNMSLSTFQRKFKKMYQTTPAKYIEEQRIEKATFLLIGSEISISEVCYQVGYTSLSHFSKVFKKKYKISPKNYRANKSKTDPVQPT
ncbi:AraC family transcriptional regulator [Aquimarina sp. 2201CG5-10]|uniref:helix-turn-helix domain-containing protein n=1 Tax=Aquimarina callyspongiae TaxID=3098150 RepID=UPI002AB44FEC|nr:AraC family transcriptional regulator [Aquimarina sp. 2201CG5-10]MDY8135380.1 AraC family transcriptional regulator [Aquimarina sp. 2201CG5-10]